VPASVPELRALFESIRDDPAVPDGALLLFDASARTQVLSQDDVRVVWECSWTSSVRGSRLPSQ
jgi:hypothetical protein